MIVERPDLVIINGLSLFFGIGYEPGSRIGERLKIISIPNITLIEAVPHRNGGRRRRK